MFKYFELFQDDFFGYFFLVVGEGEGGREREGERERERQRGRFFVLFCFVLFLLLLFLLLFLLFAADTSALIRLISCPRNDSVSARSCVFFSLPPLSVSLSLYLLCSLSVSAELHTSEPPRRSRVYAQRDIARLCRLARLAW